MKKIINAAVDSAPYQLVESDNKYDEEEKKNPTQASSTNANKKFHLKSILKKFK